MIVRPGGGDAEPKPSGRDDRAHAGCLSSVAGFELGGQCNAARFGARRKMLEQRLTIGSRSQRDAFSKSNVLEASSTATAPPLNALAVIPMSTSLRT